MVQRLESLKARAAHFKPFIDLVARAVYVAMATDTPLRLPPILLVGQPGIGKTWVLRRVAEAVGTVAHVLPMNMLWTPSEQRLERREDGVIAELLLAAIPRAPSCFSTNSRKRPASIDWIALLTSGTRCSSQRTRPRSPTTISRCPCAAIASYGSPANSVEALPESIVDRLLILRIPPPDPDQVFAIIDGVYEAMRETLAATSPANSNLMFEERSLSTRRAAPAASSTSPSASWPQTSVQRSQ